MAAASITKRKSDAASGPTRWVLLVASFPIDDAHTRMKVMRTLERLGAAVLREGVYLLPETRDSLRGMQRLAEYINRASGTANLFNASPSDPAQALELGALFDRGERFAEIAKTVAGMQAAFGVSDPTAIAKVLAKLRRDFETVRTLDFYASPLREHAEKLLADSEQAVRKLMFPAETRGVESAAGSAKREYFRRAWATCKPLYIDRLASAWLIRRFIDPEAIMVWLEKNTPCPATAVGFGFDRAEFHNTRNHVTYQELLAQFKLANNPALVKIGTLVHALDAGDAGFPEAAGVETLIAGARRRAETDDALLTESEKTFDLLYEAYYAPSKA